MISGFQSLQCCTDQKVCFTIFAGCATLVPCSARSSPISMNSLTGVTCQTRCAPDMLSFCIQHEHRGASVGPHAEIQVRYSVTAFPAFFSSSVFSSALCVTTITMPSEIVVNFLFKLGWEKSISSCTSSYLTIFPLYSVTPSGPLIIRYRLNTLFCHCAKTVRKMKAAMLNFSWFQLFVATCSPARDPNANSDYMIWGHSSLIGPVRHNNHLQFCIFSQLIVSVRQDQWLIYFCNLFSLAKCLRQLGMRKRPSSAGMDLSTIQSTRHAILRI